MTEVELLRENLDQACRHIENLLPLLNEKAAQSGDVMGLQINAKQFLVGPFLVRQRTIAGEGK